MVARIESEPTRSTASSGITDVPWETTPHGWLRRWILVRCALLLPVGGVLIHSLFRADLTNPSLAFGALLGAAALHALVFRFGARRDTSRRAAELAGAASFCIDVAFVAVLAAATGGVHSPFAPGLAFVVFGARFTLPLGFARSISSASLAALVMTLVAGTDGDAFGASNVSAALALAGSLAIGHVGAAWIRARLEFLERRAADAERNGFNASAADWDEIPTQRFAERRAADTTEVGGALAAIAAQLSHELRDPAAMIRARAESLRYELRDRSRRDDLLPEIERLLRSADRLEDLRLTLATLGGALGAQRTECDPRSLIDELRSAFQSEFERDGVRLRFDAPRVLPSVGLTHNELRLVIVRWIDAGRRASLAHGRNARIVVRFTVSDGAVVLEVEDALPVTTPPSRDLPPAADDPKRPGLALALAVARLLIEPRGGNCETDLRRGGGLVLRARLPKVGSA